MAKKWVYSFSEGNKSMREVLGGKGANLCEMTRLGINVPPGYVITTEVCEYYNKNKSKYPKDMQPQLRKNHAALERSMKRKLGDSKKPLLVSVRSGAAVSMPGMMDTILNLGLNDKTVLGLAKDTGNPRFAWDAYRRLINMFGEVVLGIEHNHFETAMDKLKKERKAKQDTDLTTNDLKELVKRYKAITKQYAKRAFPQDPKDQLKLAIKAVFNSWSNPRAVSYRRINKIKGLKGTAVNVVAMVFGNMGTDSGTGVAFTRDPSNGEKRFFGEYLQNAQGEDVVAGIRTPKPIATLKQSMPTIYKELEGIYKKLENHYKDMQDIEFTIQQGTLYMLQCRNGKRTAAAAVKIAVDMVQERMISKKNAIKRIDPNQLDQLLHKQVDIKNKEKPIAKGLPASPGAAVGQAVFDADIARKLGESGKAVILCRTETSPEDIEGMNAAVGILTSRGGLTSHAAVVARGMGKCCVAGAGSLHINEHTRTMESGHATIKEGDWITLDGTKGHVYEGKLNVVDPTLSKEYYTLMQWADSFRKLKVRANADTPADARKALSYGAEGIGLCRTEHMFFQADRIRAVREMILAQDEEARKKALRKLLPMQRKDFIGIFKAMKGKPVTIRLLDPPLHEFLPKEKAEWGKIAIDLGVRYSRIKKAVLTLSEANPMLGFRGCRLGIVYPEISQMQVRAIIEAAIQVNRSGGKAIPEIEIPLVGSQEEARHLKETIDTTAKAVLKQHKGKVTYSIGTMIELPRACLIAGELAEHLDFFSFGTNDLTQTTLGISRDDSGTFVPKYMEKSVYKEDPFQVLDQKGVGQLMKTCIKTARKVKNLEIGICGEHGGEPQSVKFCYKIGLDYVSCSPYRIPIARLAAAQASL